MSPPHAEVLRATLVVRPWYVCRKCGKRVAGDVHTQEVSSIDSPRLVGPTPHDMPSGWSSYYDPVSWAYECGDHQ